MDITLRLYHGIGDLVLTHDGREYKVRDGEVVLTNTTIAGQEQAVLTDLLVMLFVPAATVKRLQENPNIEVDVDNKLLLAAAKLSGSIHIDMTPMPPVPPHPDHSDAPHSDVPPNAPHQDIAGVGVTTVKTTAPHSDTGTKVTPKK